jgi:hypothetical protein
LSETPCTSVERLFLTPDDCLGIGVTVKVFLELLPWEWVQLLNTGNGSVLDSLISAVFVERGVNLSCAEDNSVDLLGLVDGGAVLGIGDDPLKL